MSFETFAMISFSAFDTRKIGLHRYKFHHTFLSNMQGRYCAIAWQRRRIAANIAKLADLLT
jgi:hypothetical protein